MALFVLNLQRQEVDHPGIMHDWIGAVILSLPQLHRWTMSPKPIKKQFHFPRGRKA